MTVVRARIATAAGRRRAPAGRSPRCRGRPAGRGDGRAARGADDVARVGTVFETVCGLDHLEWYGQGPWETLPGPGAGAPVGHHSRPPWTSCSPPICGRRRAAAGTAYGGFTLLRRTRHRPGGTAGRTAAGLGHPLPRRGPGRRHPPRRTGAPAAAAWCTSTRRTAVWARRPAVPTPCPATGCGRGRTTGPGASTGGDTPSRRWGPRSGPAIRRPPGLIGPDQPIRMPTEYAVIVAGSAARWSLAAALRSRATARRSSCSGRRKLCRSANFVRT